ncbi:2,3-diaminopropionate biosynthesis protein SbnB [Paenibacillus allorhizosphaerae]|uniref:N-((2S)-2-amino-2-carboxyethyl)-L-glutamate dehydrogenase n=1 Tax=Paenibacillus allorhizosphaerae TaxID=2849866 RepID=A0ABN7TT85_9BACL|nr:2,3-diaminopropionate biosynthesis protein SbnB [Paenibacillus allorhizosphaerae]CAG7650188.1 N-((2S)-2-amino-2-carboxyethyl)-L-glutamate dehydrogenase [Paenibacillus allorhizosphaerae]
MIYLHDGHIREIGIDWRKLTDIIEDIIEIKEGGDCVHPLKPYLRFREPVNRIIAMPAFVGGSFHMAGIKWVASFPENSRVGLPRAHNTIILNDPATGAPAAFFHSGLLNGLRTAAVSGLMLKAYLAARQQAKLRVGIIGWGPVGRLHLDMCVRLLGEKLERVTLYDLRGIDPVTVPESVREITEIADDWMSVYRNSDIFATCTVSDHRYIDEAPADGMLLLNISLRDYKPESVAKVKAVVVDDWVEVCRENTDVELLHNEYGLNESNVLTMADIVCRNGLEAFEREEPVYFNPMGLAIFDIGVAAYYWKEALRQRKGVILEHAQQQ